ncbi:MAG: hypothetical protein EOP85_14085 [Verrucomicrobiaceae bacterium]|nr:MAG: hypothetical protein EOP85_14085 [Verrucomicrobiaceae bacterium]
MKTPAAIALLLFPHFCQAGEDASPWPPENVAHVVAYVYDHTQDSRGSRPVFPDGSLHKGIIRSTTARLTGEQAKVLLQTVSQAYDDAEEEDCYYPHHAFVFYGADWKPVGWFAVCWECSSYQSSSAKAPDLIDVRPIRKLTNELAMPVFSGADEAENRKRYTELFLQEQAPEQQEKLREEEKKRKEDDADPFADPIRERNAD